MTAQLWVSQRNQGEVSPNHREVAAGSPGPPDGQLDRPARLCGRVSSGRAASAGGRRPRAGGVRGRAASAGGRRPRAGGVRGRPGVGRAGGVRKRAVDARLGNIVGYAR
jgi:hypothetical protein